MDNKYIWIKIKDVAGETYEYENCEMNVSVLNDMITIFIPVQRGMLKKLFFKKNIISLEYIKEEERSV